MQGLLKRNRPDIVGNIVQNIQYGHCMQHFIAIIFSMILIKKTELFCYPCIRAVETHKRNIPAKFQGF